MKRFRGGLVFKAHRLVYHSTLGSRVIKKKSLGYESVLGFAPAPRIPRASRSTGAEALLAGVRDMMKLGFWVKKLGFGV